MKSRKLTVAVVDDDPRLLESLENLFESAGYAVRTFASGRMMIERGFSDIDCLITDIGMPFVSGFDLTDAARRSRPELPVFLISGRHEAGDVQRASASDIAGFFRKPFDGQGLLAAVEASLKP